MEEGEDAFGKQNEVNPCNTKQYFNCDQKFFIKQLNTSAIPSSSC